MSASLSRSPRPSPSFLKIAEEEMTMMENISRPATAASGKQGIVLAILGSDDSERGREGTAASLRRTLSADMSSKKWLAENGFFSPMKKTASSEELSLPALSSFSSSDEEEEEEKYKNCPGQFDIWNLIQEQKKMSKEAEKLPGEFDIWSSIISQKEKGIESSKSLPPPYIHPLVKRSASSLSEKSLQICTESLGSETGSDGFSSYPSSESSSDTEEEEEEEEEEEQQQQQEKQILIDRDQEEYRPVKFKYYSAGRKSIARSFPPPLSSLSRNDGSPTLRMRPHRDNGRLVMEAVSVPSQKNFATQRLDGRLVLTFVNGPTVFEEAKKQETEEFEEQFVDSEEENEEDEEAEFEAEQVIDEKEDGLKRIEIGTEEEALPKVLSTRLINFHRLALMVNKPIGLPNRNIPATSWPNKLKEVEDQEEEEQPTPVMAQSLPPRSHPVGPLPQAVVKVSAAAAATTVSSFNAYDYFWRRANSTATAAASVKISTTNGCANDNKLMVSENQTTNDNRLGNHQQQQMVVLRGNRRDYLVPLLKGCKEPRRTLFWEPYCIATS